MSKSSRSSREEQVSPELIDLTIEALGGQGDGIARWRDETVFVPFTLPGDRVRARLGARRASGREARVVERLASGPGHVEPPCRHFGRCGGCALQHLDADAYRGVKLGALHGALRSVGIDPAVVEPLRSVPPDRRRTRLGLRRLNGPRAPAVVGFRARFSHDLVDLRDCVVLDPALSALVAPLRDLAAEALMPGGAVEITLTHTDSGVDLLVEAGERPHLAVLEAMAGFAAARDIARIVWRTRGIDTPLVERRPVRVRLSGVSVAFPPGGFLQASAVAEGFLVAEVVAALGPGRPALDLFAGLGTFAFALAAAGPVHAVEGNAAAVTAMAGAAVSGVTVERRDLERDPLPIDILARYEAAVFDPPRAGARRQVAVLAESRVKTIAAVSCNPATFARDAARLIAGGYRLERVVPVDQFVWTPHLELAAVFRR